MPDTAPDQDPSTPPAQLAAGMDDRAWLALAKAAHSGSTSYFDTAIRRRLIDDLRQFQSQHPQGSKYDSDLYRARAKFFRPKTRASVRKSEATAAEAFFQSEDVVSVSAVDPDNPMQVASAEITKELLQHRLTKTIPWFQTLVGAYQDAMVQSAVVSYQAWEYDERKRRDRPIIKLIPLENIRVDPSADWRDPIGTSPYVIELMPMYVKDVKARSKTIDAKTGQPRWATVSDAELLKASGTYQDIVRLQREAGRVNPQANATTGVNDFTLVWVHRNVIEVDGEDYVFHTLATETLLDQPRPLRELWFHGKRPWVWGTATIETHKVYTDSPVRLVAQVQAELNQNANQRIDNVSFAMNKRYFVKRTAQVDLRSMQRNVPSSVTLLNDPEKDVKIVETNDVTASAYAEQDRLNLDFDDLSGSFSQSSVQSNRKLNETVGGMNILVKDASQITAYQLRTFVETWVEPVLRQLVLLEQHYETDTAVLALAGQKAQLFERFGVNEITDELLMQELTLNVNVGIGATNPHDQLQNVIQGLTALKEMLADGVLERYGLNVGELVKEVMGKLGYRDGKRFFPQNEDPTITSLRSQLQQLQQALEAKHPPELLSAMVKKALAEARAKDAATVKTGVDATFASVQTAEVITAVPQVAPVADEVLRTAGYQPPQPAGIDPNLPQPPGAGTLNVQDVMNKRSGIGFTPGGGGAAAGDTTPNTPAAPAMPGVGAGRGIETAHSDSLPR